MRKAIRLLVILGLIVELLPVTKLTAKADVIDDMDRVVPYYNRRNFRL